jgi:aromatic ring-cleaving dioxygenase
VDGTANAGTVLTLSHWRQSGTPTELAADTSAEIVFKYLDTPHLHVEAETVSNNHFDDDGLIGAFALTNSRIASQHRELLIDAAQAGDFGVYRDRNAARISFVITAYADPTVSPLPKSIFQLRYPELAAELYREALELIPALLDNLEAYRALWEVPGRQADKDGKAD